MGHVLCALWEEDMTSGMQLVKKPKMSLLVGRAKDLPLALDVLQILLQT